MNHKEHRASNWAASRHALRLAWETTGRTLHHVEMASWHTLHTLHGLWRSKWTAHRTWGRTAQQPSDGLRGL